MTQAAAMPRLVPDAPSAGTPRIWGLSARAMHDAFWKGRGVQCVRRGERVPVERAAELYLLIDPEQLVIFDLASISERLLWHGATLTRLRLVDDSAEPYSEHVVLDDDGLVERIERRYVPQGRDAYRAMLTSRRRVAALWMTATGRRDARQRIRRAVARSKIDHLRLGARVFTEHDPEQERRLVTRLVEHWPQPEQAIDGIEETEPGIWHRQGSALPEDGVRIGPLWIGDVGPATGRPCLVGPDWVEDTAAPAADARPVVVRSADEVMLPTVSRASATTPGRGAYPYIKRAFDLVVSLGGLIVAAPLLAIIALLIVFEDGRPVLFGHRRQGRGGRPFTCWKFRTMHRDAEKIARSLEDYNVCDGPQVFIQNDPRVTRIGRVLRSTHLDELPQLWNVLVGEMSLVGPRPSPHDENVFCPAWRDSRLSVRPGITGLWQLERTREPGADFQEWIRYDIEYVHRASLWFDLMILVRTARMLMIGRSERAVE